MRLINDHFLLSDVLFKESVDSVSAVHNIDNISDHEPVFLQLCLNVHCIGFMERIYTPRVSWVKATETDLTEYKGRLSTMLTNINLPIDALTCNDIACVNRSHFHEINKYVSDITDACILAAETVIPHTINEAKKLAALLVGLSM